MNHYIYGHHTVEAAIANSKRVIYELICLRQHVQKYQELCKQYNRKIQINVIDDMRQLRFLDDCVHQGVCLSIKLTVSTEILDASRILLLDQIKDIRNIGAIIRSAAAFGINQIVYVKSNTADLYDVKNYALLAKSASGACEQVALVGVTNLARTMDELKKRGFWLMGLDESGKDIETYADLDKVALIVGCEGDGLRRLTREKCDVCCKISTQDTFPCLNASVAAGLAMYVMRVK